MLAVPTANVDTPATANWVAATPTGGAIEMLVVDPTYPLPPSTTDTETCPEPFTVADNFAVTGDLSSITNTPMSLIVIFVIVASAALVSSS